MFLTQTELYELTGRQRRDAQVKALRFMGIEHRVRPDGSVAVLQAHVDKTFGGVADRVAKPKRVEPNWDAIC